MHGAQLGNASPSNSTDCRNWPRRCASHSPASPEHRLQLAGRTADDLEHLGGRGLLLQRLGEIVGALAQLVEQPRVLDGDHGLRGEVLDQLDLLVGERAYLLTIDDEGAYQRDFLEHRHGDERTRATESGRRAGHRLRRVVGGLHQAIGLQEPIERGSSRRLERTALDQKVRIAHSAHCAWPPVGMCHHRSGTGRRNLPRKCASRFPAWPGTPAPSRRASWR